MLKIAPVAYTDTPDVAVTLSGANYTAMLAKAKTYAQGGVRTERQMTEYLLVNQGYGLLGGTGDDVVRAMNDLAATGLFKVGESFPVAAVIEEQIEP